MASYYVNKNAQDNGDHEVHLDGCAWMPESGHRQYLGEFSSCAPAVVAAKKHFQQSNGCAHCSPNCHTS